MENFFFWSLLFSNFLAPGPFIILKFPSPTFENPAYASASIAFYSLTSRTRNVTIELIVRKNFLLGWAFCVLEVTFYSLI